MLAAVQGFVLKDVLFGGRKGDPTKYDVVCSSGCILLLYSVILTRSIET